MDSLIVFVLIVILVFFKLLFINDWKYRSLRSRHSKNYIKKNYKGIGELILFSESKKELSVFLKIANYLIVFVFFAFTLLFFASFLFDISIVLGLLRYVFLAVAGVCFIYDAIRFVVLGYDTKEQKVSVGYRIVMALIAIIVIILNIFGFLKI